MGAPVSGMEAAEQPSAEALLSAFTAIDAAERRKHASVLNYWLSIRGDREYPTLHDLDPLEISDAAPCSILLELVGGGEDAEIRHLGETLKAQGEAERIADAPRPSVLASIASKLSIVAISRNFLAFEDEFDSAGGTTRCWITLLPLSSAGAWVDYVYGYVSFETVGTDAEAPVESTPDAEEPFAEAPAAEPVAAEPEDAVPEVEQPVAEAEEPVEAVHEEPVEAVPEVPEEPAQKRPGFSKLFDTLASLGGHYGTQVKVEPTLPTAPPADEPPAEPVTEPDPVETRVEPAAEAEPIEPMAEAEPPPVAEEAPAEPAPEQEQFQPAAEGSAAEPAAEEPAAQPTSATEGTLQSKLTDVRSKADEARQAKLRANAALYEGLGAAYDFALDAEDSPEEYLKLVEAQGLKIQLRQPMAPVVKLAFDGLCDEATIKQLEAVLAWALEQNLPRGSLAGRIQEAGGIAGILTPQARAA